MQKKLEDLIVEVQQGIYQVAGMGAQLYSQDLIASKIKDCFYLLAQDPEKRWKQFYSFNTYELDGVTGRTTVPIKDTYRTFENITDIYIGSSNRRIPYMNSSVNPSQWRGNSPLRYVHDTVDVIKVIPATATGEITVVGTVFPQEFVLSTIVPFDYLALKWYVVWQYMTEDDANPAAAELARQQFETRYKQLDKMQSQEGIAIDGRGGAIDYPTEWYCR